MIGERMPMIDAEDRVAGRLAYTQDAQLPGMLHAAVHRSHTPHARILDIDTSEARRIPGVVEVLTGEDLAKLPVQPRYGPVFRDQPVLAIDRVRHVGEPVAAVAALDPATARLAAEAIRVEYEELPAVYDTADALHPEAPVIHDHLDPAPGFADIIVQGQSGNICNRFVLRKGAGVEGFAEADHVFEHEFATPPVQHVSMETHGALARFDATGLTVITGTQTPYAVRDTLAHMFELPASRVRVISPVMGGGFGGKTYAKAEPVAAVLALATQRPVRYLLSREEEFVTLTKHASVIRLRTGVKRDGTLVARQTRARFNAGAYTDISPRLIKNGGYATAGPYRIPHVDIESLAVFTNLPPAGAFRGYGVAQAAWAYESHMNMIAAELGIDPVEFRRRNLLTDGESFATGEPVHGARFTEILDDALKLFDARRTDRDARRADRDARRADRDKSNAGSGVGAGGDSGGAAGVETAEPGAGADAAVEPGAVRRGRGCAVIIKSTITPSASNALLKLNADGSLQLLTSTAELGQGAHTALSQIAASALQLPVSKISVVGPDTAVTPYDLTTSS
ncbi:MAG: xanthine dehydrogenase family protein molybdopterin-binding subunit, partial [Micromonosporaceae bacterium]